LKNENYFDAKIECLDRHEIEKLALERLRKTLYNAYDEVKFYRNLFDSANISPSDIRNFKDLEKIPLLTKDDLRANYPFGLSAVPRDRIVEVHASSGTTGTPTLGLHTEKDIETWEEISARCLVMSGINREDVFQITPSLGMFSGGFGFYHGARKVGCMIVPTSAGNSRRQIQFMQEFGTSALSAVVSYTLRLAEVAWSMGVDPSKQTRVRKGVLGSEVWTKEMKKKISEIWNMDVYDIYGFAEAFGPGVANDCYLHDGLHFWEDHFFLEVVDEKTGDRVEREEPGELVLTTLTKEALPLIRYRTRDLAFLYDEVKKCDCGRTHQKISPIKGRTDDMIKIKGVNFWPSEIESFLLKRPELGPEYQISVGPNRVRITVESKTKIEGREMSNISEQVSAELAQALFFKPEVLVVEPDSLPRLEVGKAKRIVVEGTTSSSSSP
jgi:phenylacetate-CoA ligase